MVTTDEEESIVGGKARSRLFAAAVDDGMGPYIWDEDTTWIYRIQGFHFPLSTLPSSPTIQPTAMLCLADVSTRTTTICTESLVTSGHSGHFWKYFICNMCHLFIIV